MLINGIELSSLGIQLYDRVLQSNDINTHQDWLDGDIQATFIRQQDRFKNIKLDFLVLCADEEEAFLRISKLTAMLKHAQIKFDDLNFIFDVNVISAMEPKRLKNGNFIVSYNLTSGYAKGDREIYTTDANMTNSFKLTIAYYQNSNTFITTETATIRASAFNDGTPTLEELGIDINKYRPDYYNNGVATNLAGLDLTYENLKALQALIINYAPMSYNLDVIYHLDNGEGFYTELLNRTVQFTYPKLQTYQTIGQLVGVADYRPVGYKAKVSYEGRLTVEELLLASPIHVFYDKVESELSKNIIVSYKIENDEGVFEETQALIVNVSETQFYNGLTLKDIISVSAYRPNASYYKEGYIQDHELDELVTYESVSSTYSVIYPKAVNTVFLEYYAGTYPDWYRLATLPIQTTYKTSYEGSFDVINDLNIDLNKYHTAPYEDGALYNQSIYQTYDDVINAGVLQIYYKAIDYPITVSYYVGDLTEEPTTETVYINDLMFFGSPILSDIIPILAHRPDGYQFSENLSYNGEITLSALTQASPIVIFYEEISEMRSKNIIIKYKKELSSTYSTLTTNLITINEADVIGGVRLKDIINLNAYKPDYYENGIIDGTSSTALLTYDQLGSAYDVLYIAQSYTTPVRYYVDEINDLKWIGSSTISYRVIDFEVSTTLFDFGLNLNLFKPAYTGDGILQYTGPVNFTSLLDLESINILYISESEAPDDEGIDYPHRFLFLQHNDLGPFENLHPEWTMNHAYINTGISAQDMSKLTVIMECARVDENVPLYQVNAGYGYLFGSYSALGAYFMRYNNQTMYGEGLTGVNTYEAKAGASSDILVLTEDSAIGFSENSGIYSSPQEGYSRAVFTYTNTLATDGAQMPYPLYLFANNYNGSYSQGLAGIGIYACRIYYNDQLVRDFIPVQFYDKIGDLVAPSNCLYDKITKSFFEDETGLNSFNIRDDDRYEDTNLQHKIGHCYINYYKGTDFLKTIAIYFRGDEFDKDEFDLYDRFLVDENQPQYCKSGEIRNIKNINVSFDGLNNGVFDVYYEPITTQIEVNYYQEDNGNQVLLNTDIIVLEEKDFYQVPTFGDLVRLNKYKPEGYETDFVYPGSKVSLARVVENSPYSIVYKPIAEEIVNYSTVIRYIKKVYGVRQYETIGTEILTFDQSNFRDGEYIDFYINLNGQKPEKYYIDGAPYQWYEMDERLTVPADLKESYTIVYMPEKQYLDIDYYTDELDEENLIASTTWGISIDELEPGYTYSVAEILPNEYINKYKPIICNGGVIQGADVAHTFETLVELGHIDILYETVIEPDDPTNAIYEGKVLGWGRFTNLAPLGPGTANSSSTYNGGGGIIPWIDLGYTPKELKRLKVECKAISEACGFESLSICDGGFQDDTYSKFFGYNVPGDVTLLGSTDAWQDPSSETDLGNMYSSNVGNMAKGHFTIGTHIPVATGWAYTAGGPQYIDGQTLFRAGDGEGVINGQPLMLYYNDPAYYRNGYKTVLDENWEEMPAFYEYGITNKRKIDYSHWIVNPERSPYDYAPLANPITTILDAYNGYAMSYNEEDSNNSFYTIFENIDNDIFEARMRPRGSLTLFRTRNPLTGDINIMPFHLTTRASTDFGVPMALSGHGNPYKGSIEEVMVEILVAKDRDPETHLMTYEIKKVARTVLYASFPVPVHPQLEGCAIWGLKIYDRDRLVRDLIPVAKGDKIYDYIMPENGLFDLITEIFFGNSNQGGKYTITTYFENENRESTDPHLTLATKTVIVKPEEVLPFWVILDPSIYGKITMNYYDYDYTFIANQFVNVPTWFSKNNTTLEDILQFNDYKPDDFHLDGILDIDDSDSPIDDLTLYEIYKMGSANVWYKLRTFTKTVVYYRDDYRIASKDLFYSLEDIENANTLADLNIEVDLYYTEDFAHGRLVFDESILEANDIRAFIDAPSPIVVYDKLTKEEAPNILYLEYYRGGAYDDTLITIDEENPNYLDCNLEAVVLNPNGAIKYYNHYHSALYEDEEFEYFIPYQVRVLNKYTSIHRGPARKFPTLGQIVVADTYTITEERNGWGRLKEYPVGWIMLSHTEPMTGPGQNPDYDTPEEQTATIPFKTDIHINKMTIDRLWCYVPEVESWVKAEDISFNQSGKLYNALGLEVIHLNNIDFSTVASLTDMGIYPEAKKLYFHDFSNYQYEGEYTYEAFSDLHEIDFVYPETIYHYTCLYYKNNVSDEIAAGEIAIQGLAYAVGSMLRLKVEPSASSSNVSGSAAMSEGSILYLLSEEIDDLSSSSTTKWYYAKFQNAVNEYFGYIQTSSLDIITYPVIAENAINNRLGSASFSCSIGDWNPDWDIFIETSWKQDEEGNDINPDIYRDTELRLTWDYFGFDKNLYRPEGYPEGIYLWNPRSWERNNPTFTFEEVIRTGTQYVIYPPFNPDTYKLWVSSNANLKVDLSSRYNYSINEYYTDYDVSHGTVSGTIHSMGEVLPYNDESKYSQIDLPGLELFTTAGDNIDRTVNIELGGQNPFTSDAKGFQELDFGKYLKPGMSVEGDISETRKGASHVLSISNVYTGEPVSSYVRAPGDTREVMLKIEDNTNLEEYNYIVEGSITTNLYEPIKLNPATVYGLIIGLQSYENSLMTHYWVPVPKGFRYTYNDQKLQIPRNGLYDLLTGHFASGYELDSGVSGWELIFLRDQKPHLDQGYDYFDQWSYTTNEVDYIAEVIQATDTYEHPDIYATELRSLDVGLVLPISKYTADSANEVIGEWYYSGNQWFESNKAKIHAGAFDKTKLTKLQQTICLVKPEVAQTYYVYLNPAEVGTPGENSNISYSNNGVVLTSYYYYQDANNNIYYFDGAYWVPKDYTSFNTIELNKNYAVVPDYLPYYSQPVESDEFKAGNYHYGERITIPYVCAKDPEWGFTGIGWVRVNDVNLSEIIS